MHLAIFHATKQLYQNLERGRKKMSQTGKSLGGREGTQKYVLFVKRGRLQTLETVKLSVVVTAKRDFPVE